MPSPSEDKFLSQLEQAAAFMQTVRHAQAGSGKNLGGKHHLRPDQTQAITQAATASGFVTAVKDVIDVDLPVNNLFERFEEMCRRHRYTVDAELRPAVLKLLSAELWVNQQTLHAAPEKLVPATLYHGAFAPGLFQEFPEFSETPWAFTQASIRAATRIHEFLREAGKIISEISNEPEFAHFRNTPSLIRLAAITYSADPRAFLRNAERMRGETNWRKVAKDGPLTSQCAMPLRNR